jgi:Sulfotransferase family
MRRRLLRYGTADNGPLLRSNDAHNFAHRFANHIYGPDAVYSLIPKNACSTMRLSIAIDNGCIPDESGINWIHRNNGTFKPSLRELLQADYTFVVLRCPYARLASCFLDQFMRPGDSFSAYRDVMGPGRSAEGITFKSFCLSLADPKVRGADKHWQPQSDFLVYDEYDDYFSVETFSHDAPVIEKKTGMRIVDARPLTRHGLDALEVLPVTESSGDVPLMRHRLLRQMGAVHHPASLYDGEVREAVSRAYAADIALFDSLFPGRNLFDR